MRCRIEICMVKSELNGLRLLFWLLIIADLVIKSIKNEFEVRNLLLGNIETTYEMFRIEILMHMKVKN